MKDQKFVNKHSITAFLFMSIIWLYYSFAKKNNFIIVFIIKFKTKKLTFDLVSKFPIYDFNRSQDSQPNFIFIWNLNLKDNCYFY